MSTLLDRGAAWLDEQRTRHLTRTVTYLRAGNSVDLAATIGRTAFEQADEYGVNQSQPRLAVAPPPAASRPAGEAPALDVQQLSGQIAAGVQAELASRIEAAVETTLRAEVQATGIGGDVAGYRSEFGVGATLVVSLTLLLALVLSHRRETLRIKQNGRHATPCGKHAP